MIGSTNFATPIGGLASCIGTAQSSTSPRASSCQVFGSGQARQGRYVRRLANAKCSKLTSPSNPCQDSTEGKNDRDGARGARILCTSGVAAIALLTVGWPAETQAAVQHFHPPETFQIATGEGDFWVNVSRYGRYFITVLLGTAYISVKPVLQLLKRPKTAVAVVIGLVALYLFVSTTVQAMLGVSNPLDYQPSGFFPENY
ncbi:TPA: hypothetical protein ACH3X2_010006 [Trebouxia sp. C0005]